MFDYSRFMPHGHSFLWNPTILWAWVISNALIGLAYYSILAALVYFVRKRQDIQYKWMFVLFALIIFLCGTTHLISIYTLWVPNYGLQVTLAVATALVSVVTAALLLPILQEALKLPSAKVFSEKNRELEILNQNLERRVEERVRDSKRLSSIVEHSKDAIFSKSLDGEVTTWNRSAEEIFHYTKEEMVGRSIFILVPEEKIGEEKQILTMIRHGLDIEPIETVRLRKDGQRVSVHISVSPIRDDKGRVVGASSIASDITKKQLLDKQLTETAGALQARNQELANVNRAKDEFIANLAHELRSPLNIVSGYTDILGSFTQGSHEYNSALDAIKRSVSTQIHLVEDLLDMSRIISGKFSLSISTNKVDEIVESSIKAVEFSTRAKGIELTTQIDPEVTLILCDPNRIQQVLWNLLSNAVKFTNKGGRITLKVRREGDYISFEVVDTGCGISPVDLPHVFDRLWQSESANGNGKVGGLGLGLKIAKDLVEAHGGQITVYSDGLSRGSSFKAKFPITAATAEENSLTHESNEIPLKNMTILVVDDNPDAVILIKTILERAGATVATAHDGAEALALIRKNDIEIIVSDINMPVMDGYLFMEGTRLVEKEKGRVKSRPAIALTARSGPGEKERAYQSGFQLHLIKPVRSDVLIKKIIEVSTGS